jgi:hypothetical protein
MKNNAVSATLVTAALFLFGCSSTTTSGGPNKLTADGGGTGGGGNTTSAECPVIVKDADCDKTQRPFLFVHGTYGSGDNFAHVAALLGSNGFCQDRIRAVEYNSLGDAPAAACTAPNTPQGCGVVDAAVDKLLKDYPEFTQVDFGGHSQGTAHCGTYLNDPAQAAKVAHYFNFSGSPNAHDVETLSLSSQHDLGNTPHHATGTKVTSVTFTDEDHFAVAASTRAFVEVYKFLRKGAEPKYTSIQCGDTVMLEGIAETFADNTPMSGKLEVREVSDTPRGSGALLKMADPDAHGHFGPTQIKRNVAYEFKGFDASGKLLGYQYYSPFKRSNHLVRLLSPANANDGSPVGSVIAATSTDHVKTGPNHVAVVARWAGGAFRQDLGAALTVDGEAVLTSGNAGTASFSASGLAGGVVGFFMNDFNENKKTDGNLYYSGPFIAFTDVFIDTATPKFNELSFTAGSEDETIVGQKVKISNWPSTDGVQVLVMFQ